jgi:hypothetical protein
MTAKLKIEKRGDEIVFKSSPLKLLSQSQPNFAEMILVWSPFKIVNAFYSKLTFYIIQDRCQMHALKVFRSPAWLLLHKLSSPHYRYIGKMRRGDRLPLTQLSKLFTRILFNRLEKYLENNNFICPEQIGFKRGRGIKRVIDNNLINV